MNCIHEIAPWCASCNGSPDPFKQAHVPLDYSEHKYDLLDPETARAILGTVRSAAPAAPTNNPAPSERLYQTAVSKVAMAAYDNMYDCDYCVEALRDRADTQDTLFSHMTGFHAPPRARTTEYVEYSGRPAWHPSPVACNF